MSWINITQKGDFKKTESFLNKLLHTSPEQILKKYGDIGVKALADNTPVDTGLTAASWSFSVDKNSTGYSLSFNNSNVVNGIPVAILIQHGHGTRGGTYVEGIDYINPALRPIFEQLADDIWKEVSNG